MSFGLLPKVIFFQVFGQRAIARRVYRPALIWHNPKQFGLPERDGSHITLGAPELELQQGGRDYQMPREIPSDEESKEFAEQHLAYEVNMMMGAARGLSQPNNSQFVINALLESFTIHLRALIDFIWEPPNVREDDAIACDFFSSTEQWKKVRPDFPAALEPARSRTGKEVAHLTYARMKVTPATKGWNIGEMTEAMVRALKVFADNADKKRIGKTLENLI